MKLSRKQAFELSIKKWECIVENDGDERIVLKKYPRFKDYKGDCPLCELYSDNACKECPIKPKRITSRFGCSNKTHPWSIWFDNSNSKNAQKVLDLIKSKQ